MTFCALCSPSSCAFAVDELIKAATRRAMAASTCTHDLETYFECDCEYKFFKFHFSSYFGQMAEWLRRQTQAFSFLTQDQVVFCSRKWRGFESHSVQNILLHAFCTSPESEPGIFDHGVHQEGQGYAAKAKQHAGRGERVEKCMHACRRQGGIASPGRAKPGTRARHSGANLSCAHDLV